MTREEAIHFAVCLKNNWTIDFNDMEEFCDMAIEVLSAEAVQGEWIHDGQSFKGGIDWCHCSECGKKTSTNGLDMYKFCPNCGTRMR